MQKYIIGLVLLLIAPSFAFALDGDVKLTLNVTKQPDNRARLTGTTNLPPGTKLMLSVSEDSKAGFRGGWSGLVGDDGTFASPAFGPQGGLKGGRYIAEVLMPIPSVQSDQVKKVIGSQGENLRGPLVEKGRMGVTVVQRAVFRIGENAEADQPQRDGKAN